MKSNLKVGTKLTTLCCMLFILLSCDNTDSKKITKVESKSFNVYDKVMQAKTIRVGYITYPPSLIKDPNKGVLSGIFFDIIEEMGKNLSLKIDFVEEVTWGSMIESVNSGKVDIVCTGIWPNSSRGKYADFTEPIYFSPIKAYVRIGNSNFDGDILKLNSEKVKISVIDGEMTSIIAKYDFPLAQLISLPQSSDVSQVLEEVSTGKADVSFVEPEIAEEYMKNNKNKIKEITGIKPVRVFPNVMMVAKDESKFLTMINISINELSNSGFIDKVISKYEKNSNSFFRKQLPYTKN